MRFQWGNHIFMLTKDVKSPFHSDLDVGLNPPKNKKWPSYSQVLAWHAGHVRPAGFWGPGSVQNQRTDADIPYTRHHLWGTKKSTAQLLHWHILPEKLHHDIVRLSFLLDVLDFNVLLGSQLVFPLAASQRLRLPFQHWVKGGRSNSPQGSTHQPSSTVSARVKTWDEALVIIPCVGILTWWVYKSLNINGLMTIPYLQCTLKFLPWHIR